MKENYRETEKAVLDSILGKGYDKRIRPSGQNVTGDLFNVLNFQIWFFLMGQKHVVLKFHKVKNTANFRNLL